MLMCVVQIIMEEKIMDELSTVKKLKLMRLPVFAEQYEVQKEDPSFQELSFDERLALLVDLEYESRINHTIEKCIKNAHFYDSSANIEDINYLPERKLSKSQIEELATNEYIKQGLNIIFVGASGTGKTWMSCAFGVNACLDKKRVLYIRLPKLFSKFEEMKIQGRYREYLKKLSKMDLIILDEFLLTKTLESERNDLLELMEIRSNRKSTIFCSQYSYEGWHERLGGGPVADAILDRITNSSYVVALHGKSMREEYSQLKTIE